MTALSTSGFALLDRVGASRSAHTALPSASSRNVRPSAAAEVSTRVTFGKGDDGSAVYRDPRTTSGAVRLWSSPVGEDDTVSALMARNRGLQSHNLGNQWRGLGGALLTRFGKTGENYSQTLVDESNDGSDKAVDGLSVAEQAQRAAEALATQSADLAGVTTGASTAGLTIRTRSGRSVELKIAVNVAAAGLRVELTSSGAMSSTERAAIEHLATGLDRALEGLGRDDAVGLDLSGLMDYDRKALASVDLTASNGSVQQSLGTFSLHLGDDQQSIALNGSDGKLQLTVDAKTPLGTTPALQRDAAIARTLDRMGSAGDRVHANAALVDQMKSAFQQLETAVVTDDGQGKDAANGKPDVAAATESDAAKTGHVEPALSAKPLSTVTAHAAVDAEVAARLSGLADFDASFGGHTERYNRFGMITESGKADAQLSQHTTTDDAGHGGQSVAQTVSATLSADFKKAPGDAALDVDSGTYAQTRIRDSSTVTTLVTSDARRVTSALRKTDEQQLETVTDFENHRMTHHRSTPSQNSVVQWLE